MPSVFILSEQKGIFVLCFSVRSCVMSGSFSGMKSQIFLLRLGLPSFSPVRRRRKDPDEQLAFHYEIQH